MKKHLLTIFVIASIVSGCNYPSEETRNYAKVIQSNFSEVSIITAQNKKTLDFQVMFPEEAFPNESRLIAFFNENFRSLFELSDNQKVNQASINFGVPSTGFRYRMNCFNQAITMCEIVKGNFPNQVALETVPL